MTEQTRAERRRAERETTKEAGKAAFENDGPAKTIQLHSPMSDNMGPFIVGNAEHAHRVVKQGDAEGKVLVICGAGPSLRDHAAEYCPKGDEVWGVNSALPWLYENGHKVTHGITVDQTPMVLKEWVTAPPVEYLLASSVHPHLVEYLMGSMRDITFFHSFVNVKRPPVAWEDEHGKTQVASYEDWLYMLLYEGTCRAGSGLNSATRAVDVAVYRGFAKIYLLGADSAMRVSEPMPESVKEGPERERQAWLAAHTEFHADGGSAVTNGQTSLTMTGVVGGRSWTTKPDLLISAVQIARWLRPGGLPQLEVVGDVLPNYLAKEPDDIIARLPGFLDSDGKVIQLPQTTQA